MRIRSTKPEFWRSKTIARFDWGTRLVLKGLESYVDDNGVGKDDLALIAADVFPRDLSGSPHETLQQLSEALKRLAAAGLIVRYERDGEELIYIDRWRDWQYIQHPKAGRFPRPDGTKEYKDEVNPESYSKPPEGFMKPPADCMTGTGEQGNRGTAEQGNSGADDEPLPPEPPPGPYDEIVEAVVVETPKHVDNSSKPAKRFASNAAKTLVRQELGNDYPRKTVEALGVEVDKLLSQGKPDNLIRETVREWERRPKAIPAWMETVYGDVVKKFRTAPVMSAADEKVNDWLALANQQPKPHLKAIGE